MRSPDPLQRMVALLFITVLSAAYAGTSLPITDQARLDTKTLTTAPSISCTIITPGPVVTVGNCMTLSLTGGPAGWITETTFEGGQVALPYNYNWCPAAAGPRTFTGIVTGPTGTFPCTKN